MHISPITITRFRFLAIGLSMSLAGCATAAQRQYQAMASGIQAIVSEAKACTAQAYNSPEMAIVRPHFPLDPRDATLAQLSDQSLATKQEAEAILAVYPQLQACRKAVLDGLQKTTPSVVPIMAKEYAEADDDTILLVQRKISWGDRVKRGRDRLVAAQAALSAEDHRITAGLEKISSPRVVAATHSASSRFSSAIRARTGSSGGEAISDSSAT